ncbi:MAG: hypothetical protein AAF438_09345 [Pseudomonadota bacterium]
MKKAISTLSVFCLFSAAYAQSPEMEKLSWLIGAWEYKDQQVDGEYVDAGKRVCAFALMDSYIVCESTGVTNSGKERNYLMQFNYNGLDERYEINDIFSDYTRKLLYRATWSEDGYTLELETNTWSADGMVRLSTATVTYNGKNQFVWEISSVNKSTGEVTRFRDESNRVDSSH